MAKYSTTNAILDLGFVDGCVRENCSRELQMQEPLEIALDRMEQAAVSGKLDDPQFLYDLGFVRGVIWLDPMPGAYSLAMERLMEFFVKGVVDWYQLPVPFTGKEHEDPVLNDDLRDEIYSDYVSEGREYAKETAKLAGFTEEFIIDRIVPSRCRDGSSPASSISDDSRQEPKGQETASVQAAEKQDAEMPDAAQLGLPSTTLQAEPIDRSDDPPLDARGTREWTPEQRAAQAERAKGRKKPPFDDDLDSVKADFDAGMSPLNIGRKWGCSDSHIRNFLIKHGIDPRRSSPGVRNGGRPPLTEEQVGTIISEKAKGTPSKEIGEMIDRSQHAVDVKFSGLKKEGLVPESDLTPEVSEERKQVADESRAESMRAFHARKRDGHGIEDIVEDLAESEPEDDDGIEETPHASDPEPSAPHRLTVAHPGYAGKREDGHLNDDDWPHIKARLERGDTRRAIASDYDAELEDLDFFIASNQRREAKQPPGEARAPL